MNEDKGIVLFMNGNRYYFPGSKEVSQNMMEHFLRLHGIEWKYFSTQEEKEKFRPLHY
jgi:hypothetical protein